MAHKQPRSAPNIPPGSPVVDENDPLSSLMAPGGMEQQDTLAQPTPEEEELAARYGAMGIPYGSKIEDPTAIFKEHPEWAVQPPPSWPAAATTTAQTSTPQQAQLTRAPATVGKPRSQQIAAMRTMPLDVRPPGMIRGRSPGLIPMGASQRRYA